MRLLSVAALVMSFSVAIAADTPSVEFGGERYTLNYEDEATLPNGRPGNGLAEFTLSGETVDDWSKLFAFHSYPEMIADPVVAVEALGKAVKENNKDANYAIIANEKSGEAIIDFLTWAPESDVMEFNVFKYARSADGRGLVAMQYAQHIKLGDIDVAGMRALRERSVGSMTATDIAQTQRYFAEKRAKSASRSDNRPASPGHAGAAN